MGRNKSNNFSVELAKSAAQVFAEEREKVEIIAARVLNTGWKPIGESANEIVAGLASTRHLDTDWITEYLAYHDKPWDVSTTE